MLRQVQSILDKEKFEATLLEASNEGLPYDRILLFLGTDTKNREQLLEITAQEQVFNLSGQNQEGDRTNKQYFRAQFRHICPFRVEDISLSQMASFIAFLNQMSDFPGIELDELNNEVSFRYVWLTKADAVDATLIVSIIGTIQMFLALSGQNMERLATGETTFNDLLKEVVNIVRESEQDKNHT